MTTTITSYPDTSEDIARVLNPPAPPVTPTVPLSETPTVAPSTDSPSDEALPEESALVETGESDDGTSPPTGRFQKRIDVLTRRVGERDREIDRLRTENEMLLRFTKPSGSSQPPIAGQAPAPVLPEAPARPRVEAFATHEDYIEALTDWKLAQALPRVLEAQDAKQRDIEQRQRETQQHTTWQQRLQEGPAHYDDFSEAISNPALRIREDIQRAVYETVVENPQGAHVLYYLATHPEEIQHLHAMPSGSVARALGRIEQHVTDLIGNKAPTSPTVPQASLPRALPSMGTPPLSPPLQPVQGTGVQPATGFRDGMSLRDYNKMRGPWSRRRQ